jgi:LacI family transcriptional regulator
MSRKFDSITIDHRSGTRAATEHLIGLGHTRIALLTGRSSLRPGRERIAGFEEANSRLPDRERNGAVREGSFTADFGFRETSALLSASPRPTALIAGGMGMLSGMLRAIRIHGLKVPDDISVVAGADSELTGLTDPEITAVRWSGADEGRLAVQLLLNRLRGFKEPAPQNVLLSTELVIRGSCAPINKPQ